MRYRPLVPAGHWSPRPTSIMAQGSEKVILRMLGMPRLKTWVSDCNKRARAFGVEYGEAGMDDLVSRLTKGRVY